MQASIAANTYVVSGHAETKKLQDLLPGIINQLGPDQPNVPTEPPWGTVNPTANFIGYTPQLESTYPVIHWARRRLAFRGDPFTGTSRGYGFARQRAPDPKALMIF